MGQGRASSILNSRKTLDGSWSEVQELPLEWSGLSEGSFQADVLMSWETLLDSLEDQPQTFLSPT